MKIGKEFIENAVRLYLVVQLFWMLLFTEIILHQGWLKFPYVSLAKCLVTVMLLVSGGYMIWLMFLVVRYK